MFFRCQSYIWSTTVDVRVFNPSAQSNRKSSLKATYRKHELEKKRQYEERVREVEHASFTPLILSCTGGMGGITSTFFKRLAHLLSDKKDIPDPFSPVMIKWRAGRGLVHETNSIIERNFLKLSLAITMHDEKQSGD